MLILSRKLEESIIINSNTEIKVVEISDGKVKLGISAPRSVEIHRKEVFDQIINENVVAKDSKENLKNITEDFMRQIKK